MKATVEKIENNRVTLEIEVEAPKFDKALHQAYRKIVKQVNVPGFRKGKTPRKILENYLGKEPFYSEAVEKIIPEAYMEAVNETKIEPIAQPEVEMVKMEEGQPLVFKATVEVKPEVKLGSYRGLKLNKKIIKVTEEDVNRQLEALQQRYARLESVENDTIREGDIAVIDFKGYIDGKPFKGSESENYKLEIGSGNFIPGFEEQLVGAQIGEKRQIRLTIPPGDDQELAGKEVVFFVEVKEIKRKVLTPLNDEFAKDVSEFETLQELKEDLRNKLRKAAEAQEEQELKKQAVEKAAEGAEVKIPEILIKRKTNNILNDMKQRLKQQGFSWEDYLKAVEQSEEEVVKELRPKAEKSIKADLTLEAIAKAENLEVTEKEVEEQIEKMAEASGQNVENVRNYLNSEERKDSIRESIKAEKAVKFLIDHAHIEEVIEEEGEEKEADKSNDANSNNNCAKASRSSA